MLYGKYEVIDAHCHIYPQKIAALAVAHTDTFYSENSTGKGTVEDLTAQGVAAGVDRFIVQSVATTPRQVDSINAYIAGQVAQNDRLIGLGTMHPDSRDMEGELLRLLELGLKGVKLHPDMQEFPIDGRRGMQICALCERYDVPILMHTGDSRYDHCNPNRLVPLLKAFPDLTLVGAHMGGWSLWETAWQSLAEFPNLYVDCSSSFPYLTKEAAAGIIRAYGTDRVLFGTDYPMWSPAPELEYLMSLGFTEAEYRSILSENAKRVFRFQ